MKDDTEKWWNKAKEDLITAEINFKNKRYDAAAFFVQQSLEKAFKSISIEKTGKFRKIHDLKLLGKEAELPEKYIPICEEITLAYVYSRYPDIPPAKDMKTETKRFIENGRLILKWVEKKL